MPVPDVLFQPRRVAREASGEKRPRSQRGAERNEARNQRSGECMALGGRKRREGAARGGAGIGAEMRRGAGDGMAS